MVTRCRWFGLSVYGWLNRARGRARYERSIRGISFGWKELTETKKRNRHRGWPCSAGWIGRKWGSGLCCRCRQDVITAGLRELLDYEWRQLSGGMKMRVELARVWLRRPRLIVLDEPLEYLLTISSVRASVCSVLDSSTNHERTFAPLSSLTSYFTLTLPSHSHPAVVGNLYSRPGRRARARRSGVVAWSGGGWLGPTPFSSGLR